MGPETLSFACAPFLHVPLLDRLAPVRAAGFGAMSVNAGDVWALEAKGMPARAIAARIADAGLAIAEMECIACWMDHHRQGGDDDLSRMLRTMTPEAVIDAAARLGAPSVAVIDMAPDPAPLEQAAEAFAQICDRAAVHGMRVHIEFVAVGGIRTLDHAMAIVNAAGRANGGITVDAWHFHRSGSTLESLRAVPGDRVHAVQLCDALPHPLPDPWAELMTQRLLPSEGVIDLAGLIATLDAIGCTAPTGIEVFHARQADQTLAQTAQDWVTSTQAVLATARSAR